MAESPDLQHPWLVAVWPGMGHVAINAGVYLLAKLGMSPIAEFEARELFDLDHVDVKDGLIRAARRPRSRMFRWNDPRKRHDLVVFLGEAQPPAGKHAFCRRIIAHARRLGVERVFTFAAMATAMHPEHESRVFGAATDQESLEELKRLELEILEDGRIGGLNGVLLGVAAEEGLRGSCLLGEMPHIFSQLSFPKASLAILGAFTTLTGMDLDLKELAERSREADRELGELLSRVEAAYGKPGEPAAEEESGGAESADAPRLSSADERRLEALFAESAKDRARAFELKQELDRLGVFKEYEDRFLDLFKSPG